MAPCGHSNHTDDRSTRNYQEPSSERDARRSAGVGTDAERCPLVRRRPLHVPDQHRTYDNANASSASLRQVVNSVKLLKKNTKTNPLVKKFVFI